MADSKTAFPPWLSRVATLRGVFFVFLFYGLVHGGVTLIPGATLALDDVKLNVLTQSWQAGYLRENPPLFEWLLMLTQTMVGPTLFSFVAVKYALMTVTGIFAFLIGRMVFGDQRWAVLGALGLVLLYQIGWNYHQAFTHSLALIATVMVFWWALLRLLREPTILQYTTLGFSIGLGMIAKYSFAGAVAAAVIAMMTEREYRSTILSPRILIAITVAGLVMTPHMVWLSATNPAVASDTIGRLRGEEAAYLVRLAQGVPAVIWAFVSFYLPFALIAGVLFGRLASGSKLGRLGRLLRNASLVGMAGVFLAVIALGVPSLQERYLIAFLFPAYFWVLLLLKESEPSSRQVGLYAASVAIVAIAIVSVRLVQTATPGKPFCSSCRQWIPYEAVADELRRVGFETGTLVGYTDHTAGNLRRLFPKARVISSHLPGYTPPGGALSEPCYFIWSPSLAQPPSETLLARFDPSTTRMVTGEWRHFARKKGWRKTHWSIAQINHDPDLVRALCKPEFAGNSIGQEEKSRIKSEL